MEFNIDNLIADYLSDALDPKTRQDFEQQIAADPKLAARIALERELIEALSASSPENLLRSNLRHISEKYNTPESLASSPGEAPSGKVRLWWGLVAGLLLLAGLFFWNRSQQEKPTMPSPQAQQIESQAPPPAKNLPQTNETEKQNSTNKQAQPIAAAFKPIPKLETYIGSKIRSGDFKISINEPRSGATLSSRRGQTTFRLAGKIEGHIPKGKSLNALIFNNNLHDFEALHPLESHVLELDSNGAFLFQKKLTMPPGLYYLLIEEQQSGEWVSVDKFLVE